MDDENIVQHISAPRVTKKPFLWFPERDEEAMIFILFSSVKKTPIPLTSI